ncbi:MAG: hypothetical protein M5Z89_05070 [Olivibacter sp.]|nr:hypothetical protein [Olivibacter sp. UJ_SKK_5.1]
MKHLFIFMILPFLFACNNNVKEAGHIQIQAVVYNDPTGDLYDSQLLEISDLYFMGSHFLEQIPYHNDSLDIPQFAYINQGKFIQSNTLEELKSNNNFQDVVNKKFGAIFEPPAVPQYDKRQPLPDTSFNGYNYKRLKIVSDSAYTVFYINQTDTLIPFSLAPKIDKDYKGVLNRIDTYDKINDRFVSLRMTVTDTIPKSMYDVLKAKQP